MVEFKSGEKVKKGEVRNIRYKILYITSDLIFTF